jgi:hypothetical protein
MKSNRYLGTGIVLGVGIGTALGVAMKNIGAGMAIGMVIGLVVFGRLGEKNDKDKKQENDI